MINDVNLPFVHRPVELGTPHKVNGEITKVVNISVGIAGYGYWGPNLARNINALPKADLSAVCDSDVSRIRHIKKSLPTVDVYCDIHEMLSDARIDALVVATPAESHFQLAKAGLLAGKHVLVEKPMATSESECRELIQIASHDGLTLMVGHTYLYSEPARRIFAIIGNGDIGQVRYINCQRLNFGLFNNEINVAWDLAPHDLSIILRVMGSMPVSVNCQGHAHMNPKIEDVTNISMKFSGNRFATIQNSWLEPRKVRQMTFVGTKKMIVYDDLEPHGKIRIYDARVDCPPHYESFTDFQYSYHYGECHIPHLEQYEPLSGMCAQFIDSIIDGTEPESCGRNGCNVVSILEACSKSLRNEGATVVLSCED